MLLAILAVRSPRFEGCGVLVTVGHAYTSVRDGSQKYSEVGVSSPQICSDCGSRRLVDSGIVWF